MIFILADCSLVLEQIAISDSVDLEQLEHEYT